jgi:hypothetical protein
MNAQQRRKAYRAIDALIGKRAMFLGKDGRQFPVTVIARAEPPSQSASSAWGGYNFDGSRPSVHRVRCRADHHHSGASFSPRLSLLRFAA